MIHSGKNRRPCRAGPGEAILLALSGRPCGLENCEAEVWHSWPGGDTASTDTVVGRRTHDASVEALTSSGSEAWRQRDASVVWHGFTAMAAWSDREPIMVAAAEGHDLIDVDGRRYLDAISSLWVNTLGHRVPELDQALRDQIDLVAHSTMLGHGNRVVVELAEALAAVVPVERPHFLFASDGSSAVEAALKLAVQFWQLCGQEKRRRFMGFGGGYHGDTVGATSVGDPASAAGGRTIGDFGALRFEVLRAPHFDEPDCFDRAAAMVAAHAEVLAAVVVEPLVQGAAGMRMAPPAAFAAFAAACRRADVLMIIDEVATGFGRTGTLFATDQCGFDADLLCLGKGLTGGYLPMAATVASGRIFDAFAGHTFLHGHSYGGNALAAAVALRHLRLLAERDILANVAERSAQLRRGLSERVGLDFRLLGLMAGVDAPVGTGATVCAEAVRRGVLLRPLGDVIVVMPPLSVTADEIDRIVDVLAAAVAAQV